MVSPDAELFILSFAQLAVALLLSPDNPVYLDALGQIELRLRQSFDVTELQMVARSTEEYTVSYKLGSELALLTFPAGEVETLQ
ncbi:MAG: hypothetical protein ACYCVB_18360 [Bacilli bacterium]